MLEAAMPVLAVTETSSGFDTYFFLSAAMMAFKSNDFPVPTGAAMSPTMYSLRCENRRGVPKCTCRASKEDILSLINDHPHYPHLLIAQHYVKDFLLRILCHSVEARSDSYRNLGGEESVDCQLGLLRAARVGSGTLRLALSSLLFCGPVHERE